MSIKTNSFHIRLKQHLHGFSLLELALALVILGIFLVMFNGVFKQSFQVDHRMVQIENNRKLTGSIETYLSVNSRLPCPDTNGDGREDISSNICDSDHGGLPFDDLGVAQYDAWGNGYFYQVLPDVDASGDRHVCNVNSVFASDGPISTSFASSGNRFQRCATSNELACDNSGSCSGSWSSDPNIAITKAPFYSLFTPYASSGNDMEVFEEAGFNLSAGTGSLAATRVLAVIISYGANGDEAYFYNSSNKNCPSTLSDTEKANCDGDSDYQFVKTETGLNRDYVVPITLTQAKAAVINTRKFR